MFRVIYGRVFGTEKEAVKASALIKELEPSVKSGRGSYVVELARYRTRTEADTAYLHYRKQGHRVFIQKLED